MIVNNPDIVHRHIDKLKSSGDIEKICRECGICCSLAIPINSSNYICLGLPCKFLKNKKCSVYSRRFSVAPWCADLVRCLVEGIFPKECPYTFDIPNYKGNILLPYTEYVKMKPYFAKVLLSCIRDLEERDTDNFPVFYTDIHKFLRINK